MSQNLEDAKETILQYLGGTIRRLTEDVDGGKLTEKQVRRTKVIVKFLKEQVVNVRDFEAPE